MRICEYARASKTHEAREYVRMLARGSYTRASVPVSPVPLASTAAALLGRALCSHPRDSPPLLPQQVADVVANR